MRLVKPFLMFLLLLAALGAAAGCGGEGDAGGDSPAAGAAAGDAAQSAEESATAAANTVDVSGEATVITLSEGALDRLESRGVQVDALEPATRRGDEIVIPITGGRIDTADAGGTVEHAGGIAFTAGDRRMELRDPFLDTRSGHLYAIMGGTRVQALTLDTSAASVEKRQDHLVAEGFGVALERDGAMVLSDELGVEMEPGEQLGSLRVELVPILPGAAGAPDAAGEAADAADAEARDLEAQIRDLEARGLDELAPEARDRIEQALDELEQGVQQP